MRFQIVLRSPFTVNEPCHGIILVQVFGMRSQKLDGLRPQRRYTLGRIVQIDIEAIGLVVVLHVVEHIVIHVAKELYLGLNPPVELEVLQSRMMVEQPAVPSAHLVVRRHIPVLNIVFLENLRRLFVQVVVDPGWRIPVLLGYHMVEDFGFGHGGSLLLELLAERLVIEEGPRVVVLVIPGLF